MNTTDWNELASCRNKPEIVSDFFAPTPPQSVKEMCERCPVLKECYNYALHNEMYGYWGGSTEKERYARRIELRIPHPAGVGETINVGHYKEKKPIEHGTDRGYQQHIRRGIPLAEDCGCLEAHRIMVREYRKSKKKSEVSC